MVETYIDVCVATFKRPDHLSELLKSLAKQKTVGIRVRVIVVDNDRDGTARNTVRNHLENSDLEICYEVEGQQGVSNARNRALDLTRAPFIAFIDDDEMAPEQWLQTLLNAMLEYNADVVFGPVRGILPIGAPRWALNHPSFKRVNRANGSILQHGATGNVLMRADALANGPHRFDLAYSLTGGEDTDFFMRLHHAGRRLIWCDDAEVSEHVPLARTTIDWVCRRAFRGGQSFYRIGVSRYTLLAKLIWFPRKVLHLVFAAITLLPLLLFHRSAGVRMLCNACAAVGQISGLLGSRFVYSEYDIKRYQAMTSAPSKSNSKTTE